MHNITDMIINNCSSISGMSLKKGPDSNELLFDSPDGTGREWFYPLFSGIVLSFIQINTMILPESENNVELKPLRINYCISGRSELLLDDNTYIYLKEKDFCISEQSSQNDFTFPTKHYQGIALYIDTELIAGSHKTIAVLESFGIDLSHLRELYCEKKKTFIGAAAEGIESVFQEIWQSFEQNSIFYMQHYVIELLHILLKKEIRPSEPCVFYTGIQVEIAKKAEEILTADLRKHIPIRMVAEQFAVSESSLKNYFRGVYGQNISEYLRALRMNTAARLLAETNMAVSEISIQIGYTNQGKFAALFKQYSGHTPSEYRRVKRLEGV